MAGREVNRSGEMVVFVRAVELGGVCRPRALRMTPSAVSKLVALLERRLGARPVNRSTCKLLLTFGKEMHGGLSRRRCRPGQMDGGSQVGASSFRGHP
jgi:hypothetical protein